MFFLESETGLKHENVFREKQKRSEYCYFLNQP